MRNQLANAGYSFYWAVPMGIGYEATEISPPKDSLSVRGKYRRGWKKYEVSLP